MYLIFAGYSADGTTEGWDSYQDCEPSLDDATTKAVEIFESKGYDWFQVVDMNTKQVIYNDEHYSLEVQKIKAYLIRL